MPSVFAAAKHKHFPYRFAAELRVRNLFGGVPSDPKIIEGWLRTKFDAPDDIIREEIARTMIEREASLEEATEAMVAKNICGFKRDPDRGGELFLEGRCVKAAIREAGSIAAAAGRLELRGWGRTNKGLLGFLAEHVFVVEDHIHLGMTEPTGINQDQIHGFRGSSLQYNEFLAVAKVAFTVISDFDFAPEQWEAIWITGEEQGLGASRSQGRGRYEVTRWESIAARKPRRTAAAGSRGNTK